MDIVPFGLLLGTIALAPCSARIGGPGIIRKSRIRSAPSPSPITSSVCMPISAYWSRARVCELHRADWLAVRRLGRHPHQCEGGSDAAQQHAVPVVRRAARQPSGHHRRFDAAHPALDPNEQTPHRRLSHRLLHLYRLERGRLPDTRGRPAAVPGLLERHSVLVGGRTLLADVGGGRGVSAGPVLCHRRGQLLPSASGNSDPGGGSSRAMALRRFVEYRAIWWSYWARCSSTVRLSRARR